MTLERTIAASFSMDEVTWVQHANPFMITAEVVTTDFFNCCQLG